MKIIIQAVIPLFCIILVGYLAGRFKSLGTASAKPLNAFVMKYPLPILIFASIAREPLYNVFNFPFICAFLAGLFLPQLIVLWVSRMLYQETLTKSVLRAMAVSFPNVGFMGIPLLGALFGKEGILIASISVFLSVFQMLFTIIICEIDKEEKTTLKESLKSGAILFIKHPMMIATFLGLLYSASSLPMPVPLDNFTKYLGGVAGPTALFALGLLLVGVKFNQGKTEVTVISLLKLVMQPAITLILLLVFKADPIWAASGMLLAALPTGVAISIFTDYYGEYTKRGTKTLLVTTIGSLITLSALIALIPRFWPTLR